MHQLPHTRTESRKPRLEPMRPGILRHKVNGQSAKSVVNQLNESFEHLIALQTYIKSNKTLSSMLGQDRVCFLGVLVHARRQ